MAHTHSAIKHLRQTKKKTAKNLAIKKHLTFLKRQVLKAVTGQDKTKASELFKKLTIALDKASLRQVVKKNTAARKKSRLAKKINSLK